MSSKVNRDANSCKASKDNLCRVVLRHPLFWIILLVFIETGVNFTKYATPNMDNHGADPVSYVRSASNVWNLFMHGDPDVQRPFLYPLFLALCKSAAGNQGLALAVVLQRLIFICSIIPFYYISSALFRTKTFVIAAAAAYAVLPACLGYLTNWIMSEPLSIAGTVFFFYGCMRYVQQPGYGKAVGIGLGVFLLIMLRPAFLIFMPLTFLFWIGQAFFFRGNGKKELTGLAATLLSVLLILGYCHLIYVKCGVFHISVIAFYNQFQCIIQSGLYKNGSDSEINARIEQCLNEFKEKYPDKAAKPNWMFDREVDTMDSPLGYVRLTYPYTSLATTMTNEEMFRSADATIPIKRMHRYVSATMRDNKFAYIPYLLQKLIWVPVSEPRLGAVYMALLLNTALLGMMYRYYSAQQVWLYFFMLALTGGMVFTSFAASFTSYSRIILPVIALILILAFQILDQAAVLILRQNRINRRWAGQMLSLFYS